MKTLKFSPALIQEITQGNIYSTWRYNDDKDITVGDELQLLNSQTSEVFGYALVNEITVKRIKDLTDNDFIGHESYQNSDEMLAEFRKYYGSEVTTDSIIKVVKYKYHTQNLETNIVEKATKITEVKLFTDGGSRGNPGPSATGIVIQDMDGNVVTNTGKYLGITTNNQAEYQAVLQGLGIAKELGAQTVHVYMDSLLVVNQMSGIFKIKNRDLWPIHQAITELVKTFVKVSFTHVPREMNKSADAEVNKTLDAAEKGGIASELL